ncbi:MAG TPA: putative capsular polysaccharide synthesis family protein [Longimicrobium sp.]|nr:putative capsular polysaccharide synthesis family protein [Longimicrobium sp.]
MSVTRPGRLPAAAAGRLLRACIGMISARDPVTLPVVEDLHIVLEPNLAAPSALWEVLGRVRLGGALYAAHSVREPGTQGWEASSFPRSAVVRMGEESGRCWERVLMHRRIGHNAFAAGCTPPRKVSVLSTVREPVDQWIALLCYSARLWPGVLDPASLTPEKVAGFLRGESHVAFPWMAPGEWWEQDGWLRRELGERMRFDLFGTPFERSRGWQIYEGVDARLLLIRHESLDALPEAVAGFYGVPPAGVLPTGDIGGSTLDARYRSVRDQLRLPERLLERVYSAPFARHFYTPEEIRGFRERWSEHRA